MKRLMRFFQQLISSIAIGLSSAFRPKQLKSIPAEAPSYERSGLPVGFGATKIRRRGGMLPWPRPRAFSLVKYRKGISYRNHQFEWTFSSPQIVGRIITLQRWRYRIIERVGNLVDYRYKVQLINAPKQA